MSQKPQEALISKKPLNLKQERFCHEYLVDFNGAQAAIRSGYSKKSARYIAAENLTKPNIQARVAELAKASAKKVDLTVERVLKELMHIAFLNPIDLLNDDGSLKKISEIPEEARRAIAGMKVSEKSIGEDTIVRMAEIKISNKIAALDRLGRHLGLFTNKVEVSSSDDIIDAIKRGRELAGY